MDDSSRLSDGPSLESSMLPAGARSDSPAVRNKARRRRRMGSVLHTASHAHQ